MWLTNTTLRTGSCSIDSGKMVLIIFVVSSGSIFMVLLAIKTRRKCDITMLISVWTCVLDPPHLSPAGPSVASLKKDCGTKFGPAQKKGLLKWQQAFIVLRQGDDTLYEFRTDLVWIIAIITFQWRHSKVRVWVHWVPHRDHCVVFMGKTFCMSHSALISPLRYPV